MCYPKPGPRCSAHAIKAYALAHKRCVDSLERKDELYSSSEEYFKKSAELVAARARAEKEYYATPAGMRYLERHITGKGDTNDEMYSELLRDAKLLRAARLAALGEKDQGDITDGHRKNLKAERLYTKLRLTKDFLPEDTPRVGWYVNRPGQEDYAMALIKVSNVWGSKLSPDELATINWYTGTGSEDIAKYHLGKESKFSDEEIEQRKAHLNSALDKAPRLPEPAVLYRGLNSTETNKQIVADILRTGEYIPQHVQSSSPNPSVANSFGWGGVMLEIKTRSAAYTSALSHHGVREEEALLKAGTKYRLVGHFQGKAGWPGEHLVDYHIIQLEEVE